MYSITGPAAVSQVHFLARQTEQHTDVRVWPGLPVRSDGTASIHVPSL